MHQVSTTPKLGSSTKQGRQFAPYLNNLKYVITRAFATYLIHSGRELTVVRVKFLLIGLVCMRLL